MASEGPTEEEVAKFLMDHPHEMTYGRRIALWLSRNIPCWPAPDPGPYSPSLEKAWAFYDHVTLPRHIVESSSRGRDGPESIFYLGDRKLTMAVPGESQYHTKLYPIFSTPLSQMGDFGLGFGIYFATIRDFALLAFVCGLLSIPNIWYFASEEYSGDQPGVPTLLKGSAICTNRSWVPCVNCSAADFDTSVKGAYEAKRFVQWWVVEPSPAGFYLNVTDYLTWDHFNISEGLERSKIAGVVNLDLLIDVSIPDSYDVHLDPVDGYLLRGVNVTEKLGYTPMWCGYNGPADCYLDLYPFFEDKHNVDTAVSGALLAPQVNVGDTMFYKASFALRNHCIGATHNQGYINWGTILVMILGSFLIRIRNYQIETKFDEDEQTAQDYSIVVKNPPKDALDPEEWKRFFEDFLKVESGGADKIENQVRVCTVDVDNEVVINHLLQRREIRRRIEMALPPETPLDANSLQREAQRAKAEESGCMSRSKIPGLVQSLTDIEDEIKTLFKTAKRPATTRVYVTFESEAAQRIVLSKMSGDTLEGHNNHSGAVPHHTLFRGKHALRAREAQEPNTIRWQDSNATPQSMMIRKVATTVATLASMLVAYFCISYIYKKNQPWWASIVTTIFTSLFPIVATSLMNLEKHSSESSRQAWLFAKVALFNIFVTTVLLSLITPFEATLDRKENSLPGLLPAVYSLFFSQLGMTPFLQLLDISGNIKRHIQAPRAKTQEEMNLLMKGTPVHLAVRYANFMKFLYMTLFYCAIYPAAFFMGSFALIICYFVDRFSLMRSWARSSHVGAEISYFARQYFLPVAICLMSVMSAYYWSGFPFDNLCLVEDATVPSYYLRAFDISLESDRLDLFGALTLYVAKGVQAQFSVTDSADVYIYCNQDFRSYVGRSFPALPQWQPEGSEWMTAEQEVIVTVQGWTSLIALVVTVVTILAAILPVLCRLHFRRFKPRGKDQKINFSVIPTISSYIPQVSSNLIAYPLLLCKSDELHTDIFDWQDPDKPHSYYDITKDVVEVLGRTDYPDVFAKVKHWHVPGKEVEKETIGSDPEPDGGAVEHPPDITAVIMDHAFAQNLCLDQTTETIYAMDEQIECRTTPDFVRN